jgi:MerR family mercuric resistance operon transcriptional regulator
MPTHAFTIRKLADAAGVGVEAVRYYQRSGLLAAPNRVDGGFRQYSSDDVRRLRFIKRSQALGYSLEDIAELLSLSTTRDQLRVREITRERVAEIRERMADLQSMALALEDLADCCARAPEGSACPIIAALAGSRDTDLTPVDAGMVAQEITPRRRSSTRPGAGAHRRAGGVAA